MFVFGSSYHGAMLVHAFEPQPNGCRVPTAKTEKVGLSRGHFPFFPGILLSRKPSELIGKQRPVVEKKDC